MSLYNAIFSRLTSAQNGDDANVSTTLQALQAIIGTRVFRGHSDGAASPYVAVRIHRNPDERITPAVTREFDATIEIGARTPQEAEEVAGYTRTLLDRKSGLWGGTNARFFFEDSDEDVYVGAGNADNQLFNREENYIAHADCET